MPQELEATFDGIALQLESRLNLTAGTRVKIIVERILPNEESILPNEQKQPKTFLQTPQSLQLQGEPDWSEKIDPCLDEEAVEQTAIIRTERGLTIAGTRITLYDVMDYVTAGYPPKFIRASLSLTDAQVNAALSYIETHREQVEAEYQLVLKEAEALRQYYEEKNRDLIARLAVKPPKPGMEAAWEKLQAQKARHQVQPPHIAVKIVNLN